MRSERQIFFCEAKQCEFASRMDPWWDSIICEKWRTRFQILIRQFENGWFWGDNFICRRSLFVKADSIIKNYLEALNFHFGKAPNRMKRLLSDRQRRRFRVIFSWKLVINLLRWCQSLIAHDRRLGCRRNYSPLSSLLTQMPSSRIYIVNIIHKLEE